MVATAKRGPDRETASRRSFPAMCRAKLCAGCSEIYQSSPVRVVEKAPAESSGLVMCEAGRSLRRSLPDGRPEIIFRRGGRKTNFRSAVRRNRSKICRQSTELSGYCHSFRRIDSEVSVEVHSSGRGQSKSAGFDATLPPVWTCIRGKGRFLLLLCHLCGPVSAVRAGICCYSVTCVDLYRR